MRAFVNSFVLIALTLTAACSTPDDRRPSPPLAEAPAAGGKSVGGRALEAVVVGSGGETVLMIGAIHGSEPIGADLVDRLVAEARTSPPWMNDRRLVAVARANPDGLAKRRRHNDRRVDLNRNFPASNFRASAATGPSPLSEPESAFLVEIIRREKPARIISIHQPLACVNYDGPAAELAGQMSRACGLPVKADIGYATPGSLGSYAGRDLGIPIVTLEYVASTDADAAWTRLREALVTAVAR